MKKIGKKWKLIGVVILGLVFIWLLIVLPYLTFSKNEKSLEEAAKRYFELNPNELPTGERFKTLSLETLYRKSYLKEDLYIPYTNKTCSIKNSWVKVRKENGVYQYYTYLKCGILESRIDHEGPRIELNGEKEIQIGKGEEFTDPGIKKVVDNVDGKMDITAVSVKNNVDTSKVGEYEISYTVYDSLDNRTEVKRIVKVVQTIYSITKEELKNETNFRGDPSNNYARLSNMIFRIYGINEDKDVIIVSDEDIANVNYSKIEEWLEYYYDHLNEKTREMIVEKEYCQDSLSEEELNTVKCENYTKKKKIYIPNVTEINEAEANGANFMKPYTASWTATRKSEKEAYITKNVFFLDAYGKDYLTTNVEDNYGVRPMMVIKGDSLITGGDGSLTNPYVFGDTRKAKAGTLVSERETGEYISINGEMYRIVESDEEGFTRVISEFTVGTIDDDIGCMANPFSEKIVYDPKDKDSVAYFINNRVNAYIDTSYFVNHEIEVPIYKDKIIYKEEEETKKYKVKLSAPNMYEMFAAQPQRGSGSWSYWLVNSSKGKRITGLIYNPGVPINEEISSFMEAHIRVVGYLKKEATISSGEGTYESPYVIK